MFRYGQVTRGASFCSRPQPAKNARGWPQLYAVWASWSFGVNEPGQDLADDGGMADKLEVVDASEETL